MGHRLIGVRRVEAVRGEGCKVEVGQMRCPALLIERVGDRGGKGSTELLNLAAAKLALTKMLPHLLLGVLPLTARLNIPQIVVLESAPFHGLLLL
jgi:hypothetical protein